MSFIERLEYLMDKKGVKSKAELSKLSGIPYTTIDGFYKKGSDNIKLSTLKKLAGFLGCSLDFLADESDDAKPAELPAAGLTPEEQAEVMSYVDYLKSKRC